MFCAKCGSFEKEGHVYCSACGSELRRREFGTQSVFQDDSAGAAAAWAQRPGAVGATQVGAGATRSGAATKAVLAIAAAAAVVAGILAGTAFAGGSAPDMFAASADSVAPVAAAAPQQSQMQVGVQSAVDGYSWDELATISDAIAVAGSDEEALQLAKDFNLVGASGKLDGTQAKTVRLQNGQVTVARIIGFSHDVRSDGSRAGITFMFDDCIAEHSFNANGGNAGGWRRSELRSWMNDGLVRQLPDDLRSSLVFVSKQTNNEGKASGRGAVTATSDKLWVPSFAEIVGTVDFASYEEAYEPIPSHRRAEFQSYFDVWNAEGSQYQLFRDGGVAPSQTANVLVKDSPAGTPCAWWGRSSGPGEADRALSVSSEGEARKSSESPAAVLGVAPCFSVGHHDGGYSDTVVVHEGDQVEVNYTWEKVDNSRMLVVNYHDDSRVQNNYMSVENNTTNVENNTTNVDTSTTNVDNSTTNIVGRIVDFIDPDPEPAPDPDPDPEPEPAPDPDPEPVPDPDPDPAQDPSFENPTGDTSGSEEPVKDPDTGDPVDGGESAKDNYGASDSSDPADKIDDPAESGSNGNGSGDPAESGSDSGDSPDGGQAPGSPFDGLFPFNDPSGSEPATETISDADPVSPMPESSEQADDSSKSEGASDAAEAPGESKPAGAEDSRESAEPRSSNGGAGSEKANQGSSAASPAASMSLTGTIETRSYSGGEVVVIALKQPVTVNDPDNGTATSSCAIVSDSYEEHEGDTVTLQASLAVSPQNAGGPASVTRIHTVGDGKIVKVEGSESDEDGDDTGFHDDESSEVSGFHDDDESREDVGFHDEVDGEDWEGGGEDLGDSFVEDVDFGF